MMLSKVFDKFVEGTPVCVMIRGGLEYARTQASPSANETGMRGTTSTAKVPNVMASKRGSHSPALGRTH